MSAPAAIVLTPRLMYIEDLATTVVPGTQTTDTIFGLGPNTTVTLIPITLLTQLKSAANDAAAATAGVLIGQCYYNTTDSSLHARLT